jgi:hypothetical protein
METNHHLTAVKNEIEIVARYNGEDLIFEGGGRCAFGPDTTRYQSTVAVSAFVSASGEVHSIGFHKTVAAAKRRRPTQWHEAGTYAIWAPVEIEADTDEVAEPGTPEAARQELDRRAHNKAVKASGQGARIEAASDWAFGSSTKELKALAA